MEVWQIIFVTLLVSLTQVFKAVQDKLHYHFNKSIFKNLGDWWNPFWSWRLKWKNGDKTQGERFFLSSTLLVWTTDAWHLFGALRYLALVSILFLFIPWWAVLVAYVVGRGTFHILFTYILNKN